MNKRTLTATLPTGTVYVSGLVNGVESTWTNTEGTTWESIVDRSEDDSYLVELTLISASGQTTNTSFTLYYGIHLVTDRTKQDVDNGTKKGYYNAEDMNRVESATKFVNDYLNSIQKILDDLRESLGVAPDENFDVPYRVLIIESKVGWQIEIPQPKDRIRYLNNVDLVTNQLPIIKSLPKSLEYLDYIGANEIEKALLSEYTIAKQFEKDIKENIVNTSMAWYYCGEIFGGEVK